MNWVEKIENELKVRNIPMAKFAELVGLHDASFYQYKKGSRPTEKSAAKIMNVVDILFPESGIRIDDYWTEDELRFERGRRAKVARYGTDSGSNGEDVEESVQEAVQNLEATPEATPAMGTKIDDMVMVSSFAMLGLLIYRGLQKEQPTYTTENIVELSVAFANDLLGKIG